MITPQNALKLSAWLAVHEPGLFRQILVSTNRQKASPLGRLGYFGDDSSFLDSFTPDMSSVDVSAATADIPMDTQINIDNAALDASLVDAITPGGASPAVGVSSDTGNAINQAIAAPSPSDSTLPSAPSSSFWGSVASGATSVLSSVAKVGAALVSPTVLTSVANAASNYFNSQAKSAQTQAQLAATQTQLQRVANGAAPAPITYAVNPQTGQVTPVYAGQQGTVPLTAGLAAQLSQPTSLGGLSVGTLLIGGGLAVAALLAITSRSGR